MLTGDQILGVMGVLMGGAEPPDRAAWAATATRAVAQLGVAEALRAGAPDALAEPLNTALRVDGLRVAAAVLQQADLQPLLRDPEEEDVLIAALGDGADGAAGRVAYAAWLSARGEAAAAARVTEAARALDAPQ
jgi:hypothetical protein